MTYIFYEKKTSNIFKHPVLVPYFKKYKKSLFYGAVSVFITNISLLLIPQLIRFSVDNLRSQRLELFYLCLILIVIVAVIAGLFRFLMRNILFSTGRIIEQELRNDFFSVLLRLPQEYYQEKTTGDLLSRALNDMDSLRYLFGHVIMHIINIISVFCIAVISLSSINVWLTIIAIIPFPLLFFFTKAFSKSFYIHHTEVMKQMGSLTNNIQEMFSLITIIKAYAREDTIARRFAKHNQGFVEANLRLAKVRGFFHPIIAGFASLSVLGIFWIGGFFVIKNIITIGEFIAFNGTVGHLLLPTIFIGWIMSMLQRSRASLERIEEVMRKKNIMNDLNADNNIQVLSGDIKIENLNFAYKDEVYVLRDFNLSIKQGEMVAIIGEVGVGKTTIINLLQRIYNPPPNTVFYDGHELFTIPLETLHRNINYVSQEPLIFSGSVRDNIAYIDPEKISLDQVKSAAQFGDIAKDIDGFPDGYDTLIGENGITLSGGQKQRIALARAIIYQPRILILDNVFSAVDTETEDNILGSLLKLRGHITTIIVAHRVSTLKHCDKIVILKEGSILACGTHAELMENKEYREIYEKQI